MADEMPEWAQAMEARLATTLHELTMAVAATEARLTTRLNGLKARINRNGRITVRGFEQVDKAMDATRRYLVAIRHDLIDISGRLDGIDADLAAINDSLDKNGD